MMKSVIVLLALIFSLSTQASEQFRKEAEQLASSLKMGLVSTLTLKMKDLGVKGAVPFCHDKVGELGKMAAGDLGQKYDFGRTSHLLRNEKNAPQDWMKPYLGQFKKTKSKEPVVVTLKNGELAYLEPIYVMPMCLQCHGDKVATEVLEKIKGLYPKDKATGFKVGDFRGFIWVKQKPKEKSMSKIENISGVPTLLVESEENLKNYDLLIDVRRSDEFTGELGHIKGTRLVTLGDELTKFLESTPKDKKILFICRSGARSATATKEALDKGFAHSVNMAGGMLEWREKKFDTEI